MYRQENTDRQVTVPMESRCRFSTFVRRLRMGDGRMSLTPYPEKPYSISQSMWRDYYRVQMSGRINMFEHPLIGYFCEGDSYSQAFKHFETEGNTDPLVIE